MSIVAGCGSAAAMAAKHEGVSESDIEDCEMRLCFLKLGPEILDKKQNADGSLTEIYRVSTPIEGLMSNDEFIVFRVFYDTQEKAKKVEIQG